MTWPQYHERLLSEKTARDSAASASVLMATLRFNTNPAGQHVDGNIQAVLRRIGLWDLAESGNNGRGLDAEMTTASLFHGQRQSCRLRGALGPAQID
ncbi:hypothetical protein MY5147_002905, partial [Beauveria neobassiana]